MFKRLVFYSTTLTVLQPQVTLFTSKGEIVMVLNAAEVPGGHFQRTKQTRSPETTA
jgi:hypothetical protein